jgi:hypothetical protein
MSWVVVILVTASFFFILLTIWCCLVVGAREDERYRWLDDPESDLSQLDPEPH